jgi:8-oxo-dGTP pyrophosphatase MutT (NUDIX family)
LLKRLKPIVLLLDRFRRFIWRFTGRPTGVHALPFTRQGDVILVKLTYAEGWRAPGGGRKRSESAEEAITRELQEELGLIRRHPMLAKLGDDAKLGSVFVARDVEYQPASSWEIEAVGEFSLDRLPADLSPRTRRWLSIAARQVL